MPNASLSIVLRILVTAACLVLAFVGFLQAYPPIHGGRPGVEYLELAYKSVQLALGEFPAELRGRPIPAPLQIARFALPAAAAWATFSVAWIGVRNHARSWLIRQKGDHLVVFGEGALAEGLIKGEHARKGAFILWVTDASGRLARDSELLGGAHADGTQDGLALAKLGLGNARAFVAAGDADAANMEVARRVLDHASQHRKPGDPLIVIARVDDVALQGALEARLTRREQRDRVELRLASAPQLLARQFLLANPIDRLSSASTEPVRLCWIGWSPLAEMMIVRVLASAHFNHEVRLELVVADLNAAKAEAAFRSRRPGAAQVASVVFEALPDDTSTLAAEWMVRRGERSPFNAVYITLPETSRALSVALAVETSLARRGQATPIYVHLPETGADARTLVDDSIIQPCAAMSSLADPEILLQERHDAVARSIHDFYLEGRLADGEALGDRATLAEWDDLPESVRDENRLVADCYLFKLREIDAAIVEGKGAQMRFTAQEVEVLAEAEHRRWMAAKLLSGWVKGSPRDDTAKIHPDIVPYGELSERIKELDREQIRMIPRMLSSAHRRAVRNLMVELRAPTAQGATREQVRLALDNLAQAYPDRRMVVVGDLEQPGARQVLTAARDLGAAWRLVLRRPAQVLAESLASSDRACVVDLMHGADRIYLQATAPELTVALDARGGAALEAGGRAAVEFETPATVV